MKNPIKLLIYLFLMAFLLIPSSAVALVSPIHLDDFNSDGVAWTSPTGRLAFMAAESVLSYPGIAVNSNGNPAADFEVANIAWGDVTWDLEGMFAEPAEPGFEFSLNSGNISKNIAMAIIWKPILVAFAPDSVPEPAVMLLLGTGLLGLAGLRKKNLFR